MGLWRMWATDPTPFCPREETTRAALVAVCPEPGNPKNTVGKILKSEPEAGTWAQVVYLGDDLRKQEWDKRETEAGREEKPK